MSPFKHGIILTGRFFIWLVIAPRTFYKKVVDIWFVFLYVDRTEAKNLTVTF